MVDEGQQPDQPEDIELPFDPEDLVNAPGMVGITLDIDTIDPETLEIALVKIDSSAFQTRLPNGRQLGQSDMQFIRSRTRPDEFTNFCEIPDQTMAAASKQLILGVAHQIAANNNGSRTDNKATIYNRYNFPIEDARIRFENTHARIDCFLFLTTPPFRSLTWS